MRLDRGDPDPGRGGVRAAGAGDDGVEVQLGHLGQVVGHQGRPAVDAAALAGILLRLSRLADDLPEVAELDLDPVIARPDGAHAAVARIRIAPVQPHDPFLRRLR